MEYEQALQDIFSLERFGREPGLERIRKLLGLLGDPQDGLKFVHVAGTNGKGSTCALIASVLQKAGYRTGLYISPYVTDFRERIQVDGEMIPRAALAELVEYTFPKIKKMAADGDDVREFECITALAMQWFARQHCDVVVLEVGLGGRLDATNAITMPLVSVITSISLDHTAILGDTVGQIAYEKCGIMKEGGVTVCAPGQLPEALEVIRRIAAERKNRLILAEEGSVAPRFAGLSETDLEYRGRTLHLPFLGEHQVKNAVTALAVLEELNARDFRISAESLVSGFRSAVFPARLEVLSQSPPVLLDGAHNPGGMAALAAAVRRYLGGKNVVAVMGMLADKDVDSSLRELSGLFSRVITLEPPSPRVLRADALAKRWAALGTAAEPAGDAREALQRALSLAGEEGAVVICGSIYLAGLVRPCALELLKAK